MLLWFLSSLLVIWLSTDTPVRLFVFALPLLSMYISHMLVSMRSMFLPLSFLILFAGVIYVSILEWSRPQYIIPWFGERIELVSARENSDGKSKLYLGRGFSEYSNGTHSSPFFDWEISQGYFEKPATLESVAIIRRGLINNPPEIIIDPEGLLSPYIERIKELQGLYLKKGDSYFLNTN